MIERVRAWWHRRHQINGDDQATQQMLRHRYEALQQRLPPPSAPSPANNFGDAVRKQFREG